MMIKGFLPFYLILSCGLLLAVQVCSKKSPVHISPVTWINETRRKSGAENCKMQNQPLCAKYIVDIINKNRTAVNLPPLYDSPGLGCMALQYAEECKGNCTSSNNVSCRSLEDYFTEVYAPNCGVELPTFGTLSGKLVGCWSKFLAPTEAFSQVLVQDKRSLSLLTNKSHTGVGVGVASTHKGHFFWCVLFSSGQTNSSFILEDFGQGIKQKQGCFSGNNTTCSEASSVKGGIVISCLSGILTSVFLLSFCKNVNT